MKNLLLFCFSFVLLLPVFSQESSAQKFDPEDVKGITKACMDYVEGYFESSRDRVSEGVNDALAKRTIKDNKIIEMNKEQLINAAISKTRNKPSITVKIFDIYNGIASTSVTSGFIDYCQLAKINGKWQVMNVLWINFIKK
jgi:hypothetical protein